MEERNEGLFITPIDRKLIDEGAPSVYMGVTLAIRRHTAPEYIKARREALRGLPEGDKKDVLLAEAMAGTLLVGWDWKRDGEEIPFNIENAKNLLRNDLDCLDHISNFSMNLDNFLRDDAREIKKK